MHSTHFKSTSAHAQPGFTLIELMVTVVIIAILAAIAMPMYSNYITKAKARSAQSDLIALSLVMESLYQRNLTYYIPVGETSPYSTDDTDETKSYAAGWIPSSDTFDYTIVVTPSTYTLTAEGISGSRNTNCKMTLNEKGVKEIDPSKNSGCGGLTSW